MPARSPKKKATRDNVLPVGLTDAEIAEIRQAARFAGLKPTQLARAAILLYIRDPSKPLLRAS